MALRQKMATKKALLVSSALLVGLAASQASLAGQWRHCTVYWWHGAKTRVCQGGYQPGPWWGPGPGWHHRHGWWRPHYRPHCRAWIGPWGGVHRRCW